MGVQTGLAKKKKNKSVSIKKYKRRLDFNVGILLFAVVLIYLFINVISYLGRDRISVYEVRKGSIVRDNSYTGLIHTRGDCSKCRCGRICELLSEREQQGESRHKHLCTVR